MRIHRVILATSFGLGVAGIGTAGFCQQEPGPAQRTGEKIDQGMQRTGDAVRNTADRMTSTTQPSDALAPNADDIRETLREAANACLTKGGFDDLVERFAEADRNRLGKDDFTDKDHPTLDGRIAQIQKDWEAKYNQEFKIASGDALGAAFASIVQTNRDSARLASERVAPSDPQVPGHNPNAPIDRADTNRTADRDTATVTVAASHGLPAVTIPMVSEFPNRWKIDVPDTYSAQQLHDSLLKHLTMVGDNKDKWPADRNEAYRFVTHHVLMALSDSTSDFGRKAGQMDKTDVSDQLKTDRDNAPFPRTDPNRPQTPSTP